MNVNNFVEVLGAEFYTGVPDSQLRALCDYLVETYGIDPLHHIIAANEGNCTALAAGYHLATGKVPVVYMQNSGEGNIINPVASLLNDKVYAIPCIFVVGWRGEPEVHDEPQHIYQGEITLKLLEDMGIQSYIVDKGTSVQDVQQQMAVFQSILNKNRSVAFVVRKGALSYDGTVKYKNNNKMKREEVIRHIVDVTGNNPIVSTTGKASRELFEIRESKKQSHKFDFLTVGSMGHSSSIALGIAIQKPKEKVWCIDGDGALLMHMGSMAVLGNINPSNMVHIIINNGAHETVGGMPTVIGTSDIVSLAKGCGYSYAVCVNDFRTLDKELVKVKEMRGLSLIEVKCTIGAREDLGRPTTSARENKERFMEYLLTI